MNARHPLVSVSGLVLAKREAGEANTLAVILTDRLGLVFAKAQSARRERSKLRYALEPLTAARFSLVRGRYEWKLVGAERAVRLAPRAAASRRSASRVSSLVLRLVGGEEASPSLYEIVAHGLRRFADLEEGEDAEILEAVVMLRILSSLGYVPSAPETEPFLSAGPVSPELLSRAAAFRAPLAHAVDESLRASGL